MSRSLSCSRTLALVAGLFITFAGPGQAQFDAVGYEEAGDQRQGSGTAQRTATAPAGAGTCA